MENLSNDGKAQLILSRHFSDENLIQHEYFVGDTNNKH